MKLSNIAKLLIIFGIVVIIFALNMSVSLPRATLVNVHLLNTQQNILILGGLLFISGIILFATFKIKQSKEEAEAVDKNFSERIQRRHLKLVELWSRIKAYKKIIKASFAFIIGFIIISIGVYFSGTNDLRSDLFLFGILWALCCLPSLGAISNLKYYIFMAIISSILSLYLFFSSDFLPDQAEPPAPQPERLSFFRL